MNKRIAVIILLALVMITLVRGETTTSTTLTDIDVNKLIIEENAKTRADLKEYIDRRVVEYQKYTKKEVETNFVALDSQLNKFIRKASIKLGAIFFSAILFGGTVLLLINRQVNKKSIVKREMIDTRFQEKLYLLEEQMNIIKKNMGREDTQTTPSLRPPIPPMPTPTMTNQYIPPPTKRERRAKKKEEQRQTKILKKQRLDEIKKQKEELRTAEKNIKRGV